MAVGVLLTTMMCGCGADTGGDRPAAQPSDVTRSTLPPVSSPLSSSTEPVDPGVATVTGRITDRAGRAVPGAMVQPDPGPGNPAPEREAFASSDERGRFGLGLSPGLWILTISADGFLARTVKVEVTEPPPPPVQVRLKRAR